MLDELQKQFDAATQREAEANRKNAELQQVRGMEIECGFMSVL